MVKQLSILSVDDDADHQVIIRLSLELDPHVAVVCAGSPTEAVHIAANVQFDLLLIDVVLPGMSGAELAEMLQTSGYGTPIVFLTGMVSALSDRQPHRANVIGTILKPFDPLSLAEEVRGMLANS